MELDSVRGLKAEISEQIVAKMEIGTVESHAAASISKKPQNRKPDRVSSGPVLGAVE